MKFIIAILLTSLLSFATVLYLPWWFIAVAAFITSVIIQQTPFKSFLAGFIALFFLWGIHAFILDIYNDHLLSTKVAGMLQMGNSATLLLITAFIAGLVGGMAALTGSYIRIPLKH